MSAFQQLAMESYNDALLKVSASASAGDELFVRGQAKVEDLTLVAQYLLPAAEHKVEILETMEGEHRAFHVPTAAKRSAAAYAGWAEFITTLFAIESGLPVHSSISGRAPRPSMQMKTVQ
jgi:hypothetical protein